MTLTYLVLKHLLRIFMCICYLCLKDCPNSQLHVMIPLLNGASMKGQFPNVAFLAKQIISIPKLQIET